MAPHKPGLESIMAETSEATKLEDSHGFSEYSGSVKLKGKNALVTGGDSGIGRSVALLVAREGADVTIAYLLSKQPHAEATKKFVEQEKRTCLLIECDLRDRHACRHAVDEDVKKYGAVNILVNNASKQYLSTQFEDVDPDKAENIFRKNIIQMIAMAKFALLHMTQGSWIMLLLWLFGLSNTLDPKGIRVNAVAPGAIYTPIQVDTRDANQMEGWGHKAGLGRPGEPSEVATSFVFLASAEASLYYGQVMHCYPRGD
ncbi:hypothetical protein PENCOP_c001G02840 [Penicillium coprophilum]|uniref:Uncharacterized protein n=1 Tax=Penicillium coprophilum TaxID=36646 RepID=A0A1V6V9V3_9EURO|nr:hypothetical protein PENCOP_c001G02840 [Penicillium coprophilum]